MASLPSHYVKVKGSLLFKTEVILPLRESHAGTQEDEALTDLTSQHLVKQHAEGPPVHRFPIRLVGNNLEGNGVSQGRHHGR